MKKFFITALFAFFIVFANAQKNFKDGYIVLKNGDTLRGQIDYQNWEINPLKIRFQHTGIVTVYFPSDISSFEVKDADVYISKIVTKDMRPVDIMTLSSGFGATDSVVTDTVFLRRLVNGQQLILYQLVDKKEHYYIQQGANTQPQELIYKKYIEEKTDRIDEQNKYRNQLGGFAVATSDPALVLAKINSSKYTESNLVEIARLLNGEDLTVINNKSEKINHASVLVGAGVTYFNFKFTGDLDKWTKLKFPGTATPGAAIAVDFSGNRNLQEVVLRIGLSYYRFSYNGVVFQNDLLSHPSKFNYKLVQNNITPEIDILYHFVKQKDFRMYGGLGAGFVFSSYPVNEYHTQRLDDGSADQVEYNLLQTSKLWISPYVMIGAKLWNKLNLNLSSKVGGGFINYNRVHGTLFPLAFTISYIFVSK